MEIINSDDTNIVQNYLKNNLEYIRSYNRVYESGSKDVWGKYVKRLLRVNEGEYMEDSHELENWYISLKYNNDFDLHTIVENFKFLCEQYEEEKIKEFKLKNKKAYIHQLCDWEWLTDENGKIILNNGIITIVRYAKVLEKDNRGE